MRRKIKLMGHTIVDCMVVIDQIEMIQLEMADCWTLQRGEGIDIGIILVLIQIDTMIIISIILIGGMIGDTCRINLRRESHLIFMER